MVQMIQDDEGPTKFAPILRSKSQISQELPPDEEELNSEEEESRAPLPLASKRSVKSLLSHDQR